MNDLNKNNALHQDDLAKQWIDFLRKRNNLLSILWPLFLVLAVVAVIAAFHFQQSALTVQVEKTLLLKEKEDMKSLVKQKELAIASFEDKNKELSIQISSLNERLALGDQEVKSGNEQAIYNAQLMSNLESQLDLLKTENSALTEALEENKALVELHKGSLAKKNGLKDNLLKENAGLLSKLESRKIAYSALTKRLKEMQLELDRLVSVNVSQERELQKNKKLIADHNRASVEQSKLISSLNNEIGKLRKDNQLVNNQLKSVLTPVEAINGESPKSNKQAKVSDVEITRSPDSLVFEEIKAVKPAPKKIELSEKGKGGNSAFDYDKIDMP